MKFARLRRGVLVLLAQLLGCSSSASTSANAGGSTGTDAADAATGGDGLLFAPAALPNPIRAGDQASGLTLIALTLQQTPNGAELYAAVRNDGATPSCEAGMLTDFIDATGTVIASAGTALQTNHFYRTNQDARISCIDPGEIAMGVSSNLPANVVVDQLASLDHAFPAFTTDGITQVSGVTVRELKKLTTAAGTAYAGTLENDFDVRVSAASVSVFSLNRVGRPLAVVSASTPGPLEPGQAWPFQTDTIRVPGVSQAAYPAVSFSN